MRKMGMALVALSLLGGAAGAREITTMEAPDSMVRTHRLNRWGFDARGPKEADVAYRDCGSERLVSVNSRRNAGDWALIVLSAGWYTPAHTTVRCTPR